ncbi:MAG: hypothetical protein HY553_18285 [Elusimicrobia bacterium]|nr:hypothetical protein [Elusimicrobiota bacterium]
MKPATIAALVAWAGVLYALREWAAAVRTRRPIDRPAGRYPAVLVLAAMLAAWAVAAGAVLGAVRAQRPLLTGAGTLLFVSPFSVPAAALPAFLIGLAAGGLVYAAIEPYHERRGGRFPERAARAESSRWLSLATFLWGAVGLGLILGFDDYIEVRPDGVAVNGLFGLRERRYGWADVESARLYPSTYTWHHPDAPPEDELSPRFDLRIRGGETVALWEYPVWPAPEPRELERVAAALRARGVAVELEVPNRLSGSQAAAFYDAARRLQGE